MKSHGLWLCSATPNAETPCIRKPQAGILETATSTNAKSVQNVISKAPAASQGGPSLSSAEQPWSL
jgi:hypothetical protein